MDDGSFPLSLALLSSSHPFLCLYTLITAKEPKLVFTLNVAVMWVGGLAPLFGHFPQP